MYPYIIGNLINYSTIMYIQKSKQTNVNGKHNVSDVEDDNIYPAVMAIIFYNISTN